MVCILPSLGHPSRLGFTIVLCPERENGGAQSSAAAPSGAPAAIPDRAKRDLDGLERLGAEDLVVCEHAEVEQKEGAMKRVPDVPPFAIALGQLVSKEDLFETVWELAELSNGVSCDDEVATLRRIVEVLN